VKSRSVNRKHKQGLPSAMALALTLLISCSRRQESAYTPGFGEIMTFVQARHSKLWFAGQANNWPLAAYELDELNEAFEDVRRYHPLHEGSKLPTARLLDSIVAPNLTALDRAIKARDSARFVESFDNLTQACNRCHQALDFGFNVITRPTSNPFSNQDFEPSK
jgi:hypothetical protein